MHEPDSVSYSNDYENVQDIDRNSSSSDSSGDMGHFDGIPPMRPTGNRFDLSVIPDLEPNSHSNSASNRHSNSGRNMKCEPILIEQIKREHSNRNNRSDRQWQENKRLFDVESMYFDDCSLTHCDSDSILWRMIVH